jgi:hypothetical protein
MNRLTSAAVAFLLLGLAAGSARIAAGRPAVPAPQFRKADQVWPRNVNTRITAFADLDGDGDLDGVFGSMWSPSLVLLNDGHGRFAASPQPLPDEMHGITIGDVDGDGDNDLFFAPIRQGGGAPLFLNDGRGRFVQAPLVFSDREESVALIDLDNDNDLDAYLFSGKMYANDGRGRFDRREPLGFSPVGFCDLNGDRVVDAVSETYVYLNNGRGRFIQSSAIATGGPDRPGSVAFADVDGDRDSDMIVLHSGQPSRILVNDGTGGFRDSGQKLPAVVRTWGFVGFGDLTGDGAVDVIITDRQNPAQVWVNDGKGTFTDSGVRLGDGEDNTWTNCVLMDFDRDGDVDVFITNRSSGKHGLWFNQLVERRGRR